MSFFKKIFGSSDWRTCLVIQDAYVECAQVDGTKVVASNRVDLEKGVVENGDIKNTNLFQQALESLFSDIDSSTPLFVSIPSEQVYSFLKVFPSHIKEDYCESGLMEVVQAEAPFPTDELVLDTDRVLAGNQLVCGAVASLKIWRRAVEDVCRSIGFEIEAFVPEPLALAQLVPAEKPLSFALLSGAEGCLTLSLFFGGLLYDSFSTDSGADLIKEAQQAFKNFQQHFKEPVHSLYAADVSSDLQKSFEVAFPDYSIDTLQLAEKSLSDLSPILAGLVLFNKKR